MDASKVQTAAFLIRCATQRPPMKATESSYREAIRSWEIDSEVQQAMSAICDGLGLRLVDINEHGVFVASDGATSPFKPRLTSISATLGLADNRQIFGLILAVTTAFFYESQAQLQSELAPTLSVREVRERIVEIAKARIEEAGHEDADYSDVDEACATLLKLPETGQTEGGNVKPGTLHKSVEHVFNFLEQESFVRKRMDNDGGTYTATQKYRIHVKEFAAMEAYDTIRRIIEDMSSKEADNAEA